MSALRLSCIAALAAVLFLTAGCETAPVRNPRETKTVELAPGKRVSVTIETVTAVRLVLPEPAAGFEWVLASNNRRVIDQMGPLKPVAAPAPGAGREITFYALEPGRSTVRFFLIRQQETEATPAAVCVAVVDVED